jgi:hypothetical protein
MVAMNDNQIEDTNRLLNEIGVKKKVMHTPRGVIIINHLPIWKERAEEDIKGQTLQRKVKRAMQKRREAGEEKDAAGL